MRKKHRKMMKMEIRDALEIRRWVVVGLVLLSVLGGVGGIFGGYGVVAKVDCYHKYCLISCGVAV